MPVKMIFVNTDFLNMPEEVKGDFVQNLKAVMMDKYENTGVIITSDVDTATSFAIADPQNDLKIVAIHNLTNVEEGLTPDALGVAIHGSDVAFVPIDHFDANDIGELAEQAGTVASHEAGHLFLPPGHSIDDTNLMNDGEHIDRFLHENNGHDLNFTELQKAIIRGEIPFDDHASLGHLEGTYGISLDDDTVGGPDEDSSHARNQELGSGETNDSDLGDLDADNDSDIDIDADV